MIHSERDLFSSVAFFAKKGWTKDLCEVTSFFFFSPWEPDPVLFWRDHSSIQCLQHALSSGLHQLPPKNSGCLARWALVFVLIQSHSAFSPTFPVLLSTVSLKKSLLMMVAWKKNPTHTRLLYGLRELFFSPGGERQVLGEDWREARPWSKPLPWPHRDPQKPSQDESWEMDEENNPGDFCLPVWNSAHMLLIHMKTRGCVFSSPFLDTNMNKMNIKNDLV